LLSAYGEGRAPSLVFSKAVFLVGTEAWQRSQNPHFRDRASFIPELGKLLEESGRLQLVEGEGHPLLGEGFRFHRSAGHTPGMMLTEVDMPAGPVVFAADLIPGRPWVHLPITMGYDRYPERLIEEKRALLESLVARSGRLFFTHDAECALASVQEDDTGRFSCSGDLGEIRELSH
jgi:glyoxylase-like metal-dependent hydrolase (beta-lactamase superfamily II)